MSLKLSFSQSLVAGSKAAGASVIINVILFYIFHATGVITDNFFIKPNQPLTVVPVIISSILPSLLGAAVFFLFEKFTYNGFKLFSIVAIILMLLSLSSPFLAVQNMPVDYAIALDLMHVAVAFSLLFFIKRAK